ncbi:aminodeoxychorismate synthase component I [Fodinicola acaciae]|uniref:aminodeoxychorismate synthase component I n=1 Tax=Fodinicola acaciae TaxID=2681555 RepID=UPI0013D35C3C|nr:aminodeoxychorismate synthase component I [Fodinicola acaciae]
MRTLIVDNYDSFTYNVFQLVAQITGRAPVVVPNDAPGFSADDVRGFDNVIVSPGPGRPEREADLGISEQVIAEARIPLLGICLGHQALCHLAGGDVDLAPEPRHGRRSEVTHDGSRLFAGIPSPFSVVRYHSLAVRSVPDGLRATAWSDDGVLMAVEAVDRAAWGVQFHPESIGTSYGRELIANFLGARAKPAAVTMSAPRTGRTIHSEVLDVDVDAQTAYVRLFSASAHSFWLDSSMPDHALGRFSIIGDATRAVSASHGGFFDWLKGDLAAREPVASDLPFSLGWVGYLGYELKAECGGDAAYESDHPDAQLMFADRALVFDHLTGDIHALAFEKHQIAEMRDALARDVTVPEFFPAVRAEMRHTPEAYLRLIDDCLEAIRQGESYEICLTNQLTFSGAVDPLPAYLALRKASPAPYASFLRFGELAVLSSSPERFLRISPDGVAESRPIKGTRPRGASPERDAELRADLATNEKDRAENLMIVDLVRNDLGRCAEIGSVEVPSLFAVESYATVHQLVSTVRARLRPDVSPVDCVRAAFPGGSMTGAPKIRTMRIIDELEAGPRGIYSGAIGYFSLNGAVDLSIAIRTLVVSGDRATYGTGGAIVAMSDPAAEFRETTDKSAAIRAVLSL